RGGAGEGVPPVPAPAGPDAAAAKDQGRGAADPAPAGLPAGADQEEPGDDGRP
ncbi:unnamed protein product, partial [Heterosigma akashiwo]